MMARWTGTTTQRGYGAPHQNERRKWKPVVDAGQAHCHAIICLKPSRVIVPGESWHLGHTADRTAWTGPEHEHCNLADGARRKNRKQRQRTIRLPAQMMPSRRW
jgi:hypothetical protein